MIGSYSDIAAIQLDNLERNASPEAWNAVCDALELILAGRAREVSAAITTSEGVRMMLSVAAAAPLKIFWSTEGPRVEAVFSYTR